MEWKRRVATTPEADEEARPAPRVFVPVGASFAFDPGADGLAGMYASRVLERGVDPRALCAEVRADRRGTPEHGAVMRALLTQPRVVRFGRGTAAHLQATAHPAIRVVPRAVISSRHATAEILASGRDPRVNWPRRLAAAGVGLLLLLPLTALI
jgi:hypothetical protein